MSLVREAFERGRDAAHFGFMRVSPFYDERVLINNKRIDITPMLDTFFYAGFDGEPYPDKPDALEATPDSLPAVERIAPESATEGQDEVGTPCQSATGPCEEGSDS